MKPSDDWEKWEPNGAQPERRNPWEDFPEPDKAYQDWEKGRGHRRYEFLVPVSGLIAKIKGLFRGEKT